PRMPSEKSYSGRISSLLFALGCGLIVLALFRARLTSVDDSHSTRTLRVGHDKEPTASGEPDAEKSAFVFRVIRIHDRQLQRVAEDRHRFGELDAMLFDVRGGLLGIPLKFHRSSLPCPASF
ncbi:MAG: hypothetical protein ACRD1S_15595, partial [Vicinamibacterales bacterium]